LLLSKNVSRMLRKHITVSEAPKTNNRLPLSFHRTFVPERRYITALLDFAANEGAGTVQDISAQTGIPTGKSSGKVPAILDYCYAMGLLGRGSYARGSEKAPRLTPFGRVVWLEDRHLAEGVTQWLAHFHMCRPDVGADAWHHVFAIGRGALGLEFTAEEFEAYLANIYGPKNRSLAGPMVRMYEEPAAFRAAGVLRSGPHGIERRVAPVLEEFGNGYTAWLLKLLETHFPDERQTTVDDLNAASHWQSIAGWSPRQADLVLSMAQAKEAVDVDRQMRPWVISRRGLSENCWHRLYEDLV